MGPRGTRGRALRGALIHVGTCSFEALQDSRLVAVDDRVVGSADIIVPVRDSLVGAGGGVRLVAFHGHVGEAGKVVAVLLDLIRVPVDGSTSPVNRALCVGLETTGPDGELDTGRRLGELELVARFVERRGLEDTASKLPINVPFDLLWCPFNFVLVPVVVGIAQLGDISRVGV